MLQAVIQQHCILSKKKRERGTLQQQKQLREETENPIFVMDIPETYINSIQNAIQPDVNKEDDN